MEPYDAYDYEELAQELADLRSETPIEDLIVLLEESQN